MHLNGSRFLLRICRALNLDKNQFVEVLSRIYQRQKECLDGSRIYQESIDQTESTKNCLNGSKKLSRMCRAWTQKSRWVKKLSRFYREEARNLDGFRSYQDAIEKVESVGKIQDGSRNCQGSIEKGERKVR